MEILWEDLTEGIDAGVSSPRITARKNRPPGICLLLVWFSGSYSKGYGHWEGDLDTIRFLVLRY
jgi:hypothetical protein